MISKIIDSDFKVLVHNIVVQYRNVTLLRTRQVASNLKF